MSILTAPETSPWARRDPVLLAQRLGVHLGTPLLAAAITAVTGLSGTSGFFIAWLPLHVLTAYLLGRFGRRKQDFANTTLEVLLGFGMVVFLTFAGSLIWPVLKTGVSSFQWNLITQDAKDTGVGADLSTGGMLQAILGSIEVVALATVVSVPIGILAALYVTEVRGRLTPLVRFFVQAMSGVPSVVAGLFVYAALIVTGHLSYSGFAGALALAILMLPTVARTAEEILRLVQDDLRTAAMALGATQWRAVSMVVLPAARSGLVTAAILGIARVAGETAPLLLTAFGNKAVNLNPFEGPIAALPLYVFQQMLLGNENDVARAWVACLVLLTLVTVLFASARYAAQKMKQA